MEALIKIVSDGGGMWGLSDEAYVRWWKALPQDDQLTFEMLGGDDLLGRFVCAYDFLSCGEGENPHTLVRAWAIASASSEEANETRVLAQRAWESPAVRELLDRLMSREKERAERRIERATTRLVEETLDQALGSDSIDGRVKAINAAARFLAEISDDRKQVREIRARLENEALKKAITQKPVENEDDGKPLTHDDAAAFMRTLVARFGAEEIRALLPGAEPN